MIKQVEGLEAQLKFFRFGDFRILQQGHVEVVQSGPMEESATGVAELAYLFIGEERRIEVRVPMAWVRVGEDLAACKVGDIHRSSNSTDQLIGIVLCQ